MAAPVGDIGNTMFDLEESKFASTWKEMSLDLKLLYLYCGSIMALGLVRSALSIEWQFVMAGSLLLVVATIAIQYRLKSDWHWPGVGVQGVLGTLLSGAIGIFFFGAAAIRVSPLDPRWFPWFAFGGGIILFGVLAGLNLVVPAKSDFQRCCGQRLLPEQLMMEAKRRESPWKRTLLGAFAILGTAVWLVGVGYFWQLNVTVRDAAAQPTPPKTELLEGRWLQGRDEIAFVTPIEKETIIFLEQLAIYGLICTVVAGVLLQFLFKANRSDEAMDPAEHHHFGDSA